MKEFRSWKSEVSRLILLTFVILSIAFSIAAQVPERSESSSQAAEKLFTEFDVNGLKVIFKRRPGAPTVSAGLFVRGGVANQTTQNAGLEGLTLQTATEASKRFPRELLRKELSRMGSSIGAGASYDFSVLQLASTRQNFDRTWEIFTDTALNPAFTAEDFALIRERTLTILRNQSVSPDDFLDVQQEKVIYAGHPYINDPTGTIETVGAFKLEDLRAYHQKIMQTSRLLLVVVGDLDAAALRKQVEASFGKLARGEYKAQTIPSLNFEKPTLDIAQKTLPTNYVKGVFSAPSLNNPDYHAMRVAITILQSRVYQEVRVKRNLSYLPNAEMEDNAANTANIYVTATDANQAVRVMLNEIQEMKNAPISEEDYVGIPSFFLTNYYVKQETNAAQVAELARYELIGGGWRNSLDFLTRIRRVTPRDVQAVSNKYFKNIRFIVVGNPSAISKEVFLPN